MPSRPVSAAQHRVATFQSGASANHSMFLAPHLWQKSSGWIVGQPALRSFSISAGGIDWALMLRLSVRHVTAYDHEAATHPAPQNAHRPCRAHPANTPQRQGTCRKCFSRLESSPCSPRLRRTSWVARRRGWGRCLRRRLSHATTHSRLHLRRILSKPRPKLCTLQLERSPLSLHVSNPREPIS